MTRREGRASAPATFSVIVRWRGRRLTLRRGEPDLPTALAFAEAMRRDRFHDTDAVVVVDDATGAVVGTEREAVPPRAPAEPPPPPPPPSDRLGFALARAIAAREAFASACASACARAGAVPPGTRRAGERLRRATERLERRQLAAIAAVRGSVDAIRRRG